MLTVLGDIGFVVAVLVAAEGTLFFCLWCMEGCPKFWRDE